MSERKLNLEAGPWKGKIPGLVIQKRTTKGQIEAQRDTLALFVRRMLRVMSMNGLGDREVCQQAQRYLKAIGATGSVLRDDDIQEQS